MNSLTSSIYRWDETRWFYQAHPTFMRSKLSNKNYKLYIPIEFNLLKTINIAFTLEITDISRHLQDTSCRHKANILQRRSTGETAMPEEFRRLASRYSRLLPVTSRYGHRHFSFRLSLCTHLDHW